jgi:hypothetical protein
LIYQQAKQCSEKSSQENKILIDSSAKDFRLGLLITLGGEHLKNGIRRIAKKS